LTQKQWLVVLLFIMGASLAALTFVRRPRQPVQVFAPHATVPPQLKVGGAYADPAVCATCHQEIARTYSLTGMARSFSRVNASRFPAPISLHHKASGRYYTSVARDGRFYQRRHQIGADGREANVLEVEAHYVIGSGNHARTFLHREADGRLLQLPVSWYAEGEGYWAMSPGYDKPAHLDFRRPIDEGCMSCHNGYPPSLAGAPASSGATSPPMPHTYNREAPRFGTLLEGIDCQRCHGAGQAHVDGIKRGELEVAVRAIVNPATLDRDRQLETCMQCHLESTSTPLPFQIQRYEHPAFSYAPGRPLADYFIHFDHAPGTGRDDKFEIAGGAYRLRKSACFQRSEMTCVTCHDPHDVPRGAKAVERYVAICRSCHEAPHRSGVPRVAGAGAGATCLDCHMPKRRAEDAVHVVMTDHYIQRQRPPGNLVAERTEADSQKHGDYRGEVVLYYPPALPSTPQTDLYLALAQVQQGSNVAAGIRRLEDAIARHRPARPEFYYELGRAYGRVADHDAVVRWCREALRRDSGFAPALKELAAAATAKGDFAEAAEALRQAVTLRPYDANAFSDLGSVYLRQNRGEDARKALQQALALDPTLPAANNMMGLAWLQGGNADAAERHLREAIRFQPDLSEAHNNLGNLLAARRDYTAAAYHFERAIAANPQYVEARHSYGMVLGVMRKYPQAVAELEAVLRMSPELAQARLDLADVLAAVGRVGEARAQLEAAAKSGDAETREAALAGLRGLGR
jgi:predicted CXXCH cytochrome family protein